MEFMPYENANEVVDKPFESPFSWYEIGLETSMRERERERERERDRQTDRQTDRFYFQFCSIVVLQISQVKFKRGA